MEVFQAVILGIIQGITEFLPISSSGHLVLTPWLFVWEDPGLSFNVALHFGTLIAVLAYFWRDWLEIFASVKNKLLKKTKNKKKSKYNSSTLWLLVIATIPGILAGYFFNDYAETVFRNPLLIAFTLVIFGLLLYMADRQSKTARDISELSLVDSVVIGLAQAIAIIPGVSRSGVTITAGLMQGLDRKSAARFSFLLSTPVILGATVFQAKNFFASSIGMAEILGIAAAAVSGYFAIFGLLRFVEGVGYRVFFWYRLFLGMVILLMVLLK